MRQHILRPALAAFATLTALAVPTLVGPTPAYAAGTPLPAHVYAPYFETWTSDSITTTAQQSGTKYYTLAFLETLSKSSCTLAWNGSKSQTLASGRYVSDIASLRALGGDVIPSFGGWSADQGGTEIGDSCKDVNAIAAAYEQVVTTYNVTRLDMDIEGRSLTKSAGIDRRNKAIALAQAWATAHSRTLQVQYTLPTSATGLESSGVAVLQNAVANGVRIDLVNPMVFDYYDGTTTKMGAAAISASQGLHSQLATLMPGKTAAQLWALQGATMMNGVDDYPKHTEVTSLADAQQLLTFAQSKGMSALSIWAIQRDNGGCPGARAANDCSGIVQKTWDFSHLLNPFTG
jgi:glycosyl hydrolase family 18 (putative chitinase)